MPIPDRFTRAPYLEGALTLSAEMAYLSTVGEPVGDDVPEPADPPAHLQRRINRAVREAAASIRARRPRLEHGRRTVPQHLIRAAVRLHAEGWAVLRIARHLGLDKDFVKRSVSQESRVESREPEKSGRCPDCGGMVLDVDQPCRLCFVRRL